MQATHLPGLDLQTEFDMSSCTGIVYVLSRRKRSGSAELGCYSAVVCNSYSCIPVWCRLRVTSATSRDFVLK